MILVDRVGPASLFRGARPTRDDLSRFDFDINLEVGWYEWLTGHCRQEQEWCQNLKVNYVHMPMSDFTRPPVIQLVDITDLIHDLLAEGKNVLVHCLHGEDRTGLVIAAYRIRFHGWPLNQALTEMYGLGFHTFPYKFPLEWQRALYGLKPAFKG